MSRVKDQYHNDIIANGSEAMAEQDHSDALASQFDNFKPCCRLAYLFGRADRLIESCAKPLAGYESLNLG